MIDNIFEINTKLSTRWKEYVEKKLNCKFELEGGVTFKSGTKWSLTDKGIFVEYKGKKTQLTDARNLKKFLKPSTISKNYGKGGTSFVRDILGVVDYSSASKKTQQLAEKTSISLRDAPKVGETPTGREGSEIVRRRLVNIDKELDDFSDTGPKPDVPDTPIEPPKPPEPPKPKTWTDWLKDQLQKIANLLLKLGDKALIALPGIIGAVVNFVLKSAGAVAGFLADHLWAFAVVVGGILYTSVMEIRKK